MGFFKNQMPKEGSKHLQKLDIPRQDRIQKG
jgi:hypothetical protein